jgi:hypothetical protein
MSKFQHSLTEWLAIDGNTQNGLGAAIGVTQVAIHRYAAGSRFPDVDTARKIDAATAGAVPFSDWQADFLERSGITAAQGEAA